jgi:hypothetical protein
MSSASDSYVEYLLARDSWSMMVRLAEAALYTSLAPPGTQACDAGGGAIRPQWREGPVSAW